MVEYFYNLDYSEDTTADLGSPLANHVRMCVIADKYDIKPLQDLAIQKFKKRTESDKMTEGELTEAALIAYEFLEPSREICAHIVNLVVEKKVVLQDVDPVAPTATIEMLMRTCPEFATDFIKAVGSKLRAPSHVADITCYYCGLKYTIGGEKARTIIASRRSVPCCFCSEPAAASLVK